MNEAPWIKNTYENPFFRSKDPVEVRTKFGTVKELACPRCARGWMSSVVEWRPLQKKSEG